MKINFIRVFTFLIILAFGLKSFAQFTPEEIAEREKWEEFLKTAKIIGQVQQESREAVTQPWELILEKDGVTRKALWKDAEGRMRGYIENWKWEIAAYRLDKYLGLNMISTTVEKEFRGKRGSCQLWVDYWIKAKQKNEQKIKVLSYKVISYNRATYLRWAFDNLIANNDRHPGNFFITKDWRLILPDLSRSFHTSKKSTKNLIYTEKHKECPRIMKELSRAFVEKLKSLNFEIIRDAVGKYLTDKEINAVLMRRDLILKTVYERIKKFSEDQVLY
jgi:hypothetical protein